MNKKVMSILASAAVLTAAAANAAPINVSAAEGQSLLVLGDSIASGYGLDGYVSGDNSSAADSFANKLAADFSGYANYAVDGRTSAELLSALYEDELSAQLEKSDTVVISIGGNDFLMPVMTSVQMSLMSDPELLKSFVGGNVSEEEMMEKLAEIDIEAIMISAAENVDIEQTGKNIADIVDTVFRINPDCDVYILTVYNPFEASEGAEDMSDLIDTADERIGELNHKIEAAALGHDNAHAVDVNEHFKGHAVEYTNISKMDVHPNKTGHAEIYDMLSAAMAENVKASEAAPEETVAADNAPETEAPAVTEAPAPISDGTTGGASTGNTSPAVYAVVSVTALCAAAAAAKRKAKA